MHADGVGFLYVSPEKSISSRNTSDRTTLYISPPPAQSALAEPERERHAQRRITAQAEAGRRCVEPAATGALGCDVSPPSRPRSCAAKEAAEKHLVARTRSSTMGRT